MRRFYLVLSGLLMLSLLSVSNPVLAQNPPVPNLAFQFEIPGISEPKFPSVAGFERQIHVVTNSSRRDLVYLTKQDTASAFSPLQAIGRAEGTPDYSPGAVATGVDGTVHVAWINAPERKIYYTQKPLGGVFGPIRTAYVSSNFPANLHMNVASDGGIFIGWREVDAPIHVVRSGDNGVNWSSPYRLGGSTALGAPTIARGLQGQIAIPYAAGFANGLRIFVAFWNGNGFDAQLVSPFDGDYADPGATFAPDGQLYLLWRGIENSPNSGIWLGTYQGGTQWQINRLTDRVNSISVSNIFADTRGNLHAAWIADFNRTQHLFYSIRPRGGVFGNPLMIPNPGGSIFNGRIATTLGDGQAFTHVVHEVFGGNGVAANYVLVSANIAQDVNASPVIEGGAPIARFDTTSKLVQVRFDNIQGDPVQMRWRWGESLDPTNDDSGGWQAFANPALIEVPERIINALACTPVMLYTQVRGDDGSVSPVQSDDIILDGDIDASVYVGNPYGGNKAPIFTALSDLATLADDGRGGASKGHPAYTRAPLVYLELRSLNDCSQLHSVAIGRDANSVGEPTELTNERFANVVAYPGTMTQGANLLVVRVTDKVGNLLDYPATMIYDTVKPVLASSAAESLTATVDLSATIVTRLTVRDVAVTDTLYPGRGFWGVWVANSRTPVASPATSSALNWIPIEVPGDASSFDLAGWSLANGLEASAVTPGDYYIYLRFLDGAGNASDGVISTMITVETITQPKVYLPLIRR
ncbi:MAG: exo-alpha-sialidase [Chloroflexia bacterium]|nr:exo-alpha-sialidase [Chloroflexia bacterium]